MISLENSFSLPFPRHRVGSSLWDYTVFYSVDKRIIPTGNCGHCGGHNSGAAARQCYYEYLMSRLNPKASNECLGGTFLKPPELRCTVCQTPSLYSAWIYPIYWRAPLCTNHANEETVRSLLPISNVFDSLELWYWGQTKKWRLSRYASADDKDLSSIMQQCVEPTAYYQIRTKGDS
jgi:hypothetical protein